MLYGIAALWPDGRRPAAAAGPAAAGGWSSAAAAAAASGECSQLLLQVQELLQQHRGCRQEGSCAAAMAITMPSDIAACMRSSLADAVQERISLPRHFAHYQ
jgi:hypothetical protein